MAAPITKKRPRRPKSQLPHCYYEGYLEKRAPKEKASQKLWTSLCGNTLFFFNHTKDSDYTEKLELRGFVSLTDDGRRSTNLDTARFTLRLKNGALKFTAPSLEARELWKGYIYSVVELAVPTFLNLLPGQVHMLREVIEKEMERRKPPPLPHGPIPSLYVPLLGDLPSCYHPVSRTEAEMLLERHQENGNFLLRPGKAGNSMAITTYQDLNGPVFRHYRVARKPDGGFSIDVENPIPCATLHDVIHYMVEMTSGTLTPLILEETYDENITFVLSNDENGEKSVQSAPNVPDATAPTPIPEPGLLTDCESSRDMESSFEGLIYMNDPCHAKDESSVACFPKPSPPPKTGHAKDESSVACFPKPSPPPKSGKKALLPKSHSSERPEGQINCPSGKKTPSLLPKSPSLSSLLLQGQNNQSGYAEDENSTACTPTPPPKPVKKLPKAFSFSSLPDGQNGGTAADTQVIRRPVPAPRSTKSAEGHTRVRRSTTPSLTDDALTAALSLELKEKLEMMRAKH